MAVTKIGCYDSNFPRPQTLHAKRNVNLKKSKPNYKNRPLHAIIISNSCFLVHINIVTHYQYSFSMLQLSLHYSDQGITFKTRNNFSNIFPATFKQLMHHYWKTKYNFTLGKTRKNQFCFCRLDLSHRMRYIKPACKKN